MICTVFFFLLTQIYSVVFVAGMFLSSTKTRVAPAPLREKDSDLLVGGERAAVEMKNGAPARKSARRRALARSRIFARVSKMRFGFVGAGGSECTCVLVRWEKDLGGRSRRKFWARDYLARLGKCLNGGRKELR